MRKSALIFLILIAVPFVCMADSPIPAMLSMWNAAGGAGPTCTSTEYSVTTETADKNLVFRSTVGVYGYNFLVGGSARNICKVSGTFHSRTGSPSPATFHAEIWSESAAQPNAQVGVDSSSVSFTLIPTDTTSTEVEIEFPTPVSVSAATRYWVIFVPDWTMDTGSYCVARYTGTSATSSDYIATSTNESTWTTNQFAFGTGKVYYAE